MTPLELLVLSLAAWRVTAYLVYENSGQWIRDKVKVYAVDDQGRPISFWGKVLSCFWCTSIFVALGLGLLWTIGSVGRWGIYVLAASGAAVILNHTSRIFRLFDE